LIGFNGAETRNEMPRYGWPALYTILEASLYFLDFQFISSSTFS